MEILGYIFAVFVGISLGVFGSGGSILALPILVYCFGIPAEIATGYSLFVVGAVSLLGAWRSFRRDQLDLSIGSLMAISGVLGVYIARTSLLYFIPESFSFLGWSLSKDQFLLSLFGAVVMLASWSLIQSKGDFPRERLELRSVLQSVQILFEGFLIGVFSGLVGAGGGFLIVPLLVEIHGLSMKKAVGTSLFIITLNSFLGLSSSWLQGGDVDIVFISSFVLVALLGVVLGSHITDRIDTHRLRPYLGFFILTLGVLILSRELFHLF